MKDQKGKPKLVKVKILKHVGNFLPGQVVEVEPEVAEQLCLSSEVNFGADKVKHQRAMLHEDFVEAEAMENAPENLTMKQAKEKNIKVVTKTPESGVKLAEPTVDVRGIGEEQAENNLKKTELPDPNAKGKDDRGHGEEQAENNLVEASDAGVDAESRVKSAQAKLDDAKAKIAEDRDAKAAEAKGEDAEESHPKKRGGHSHAHHAKKHSK